MKKMRFQIVFALFFLFLGADSGLTAQTIRMPAADSDYRFEHQIDLAATVVKNQAKSNTCWSFATYSFLESELLRLGKPPLDLSELFTVRKIYTEKAQKYVRMLGKTQFAAGGQSHDVLHSWKTHGLVPQKAYPGKQSSLDHLAFDDQLRAWLDSLLKMPENKLDLNWRAAFELKLDNFLGVAPTEFEHNGQTYTPQSYAKSLGINPDDYIEIGSFSHHPFYEEFILECPDNWSWSKIWNVPLPEFQEITDYALKNGFSVCWDADVSEPYFSHKRGMAVLPPNPNDTMIFKQPSAELVPTQASRQAAFDDLSTQDDHLMHIIGVARAQKTDKDFYIVKNSWGQERNSCGGFLYVSKPYFQYKTIMIMVHRDAIPPKLRAQLPPR
jgi:bleomycin hydrolase